MKPLFTRNVIGRSTVYRGDCLRVMPTMRPDSVSSIVTDPPYGLGFMGHDWDHGVPGKHFWEEMLRLAKPGAHLLAFGGTRTFHRLAVAIEDAGWEIRDTLMWVYGSGFPKSHNISKAIDKAAGKKRKVIGTKLGLPGYSLTNGKIGGVAMSGNVDGSLRNGQAECDITTSVTAEAIEWDGWGTALKPAWEPIILARKPLEGTVVKNVLKYGTGGINVDKCRVPHVTIDDGNLALNPHLRKHINGGNGGNIIAHEDERRVVIPNQLGRWPANVIHDGSDEVVELFPTTTSGKSAKGGHKRTDKNMKKGSTVYGAGKGIAGTSSTNLAGTLFGDTGSAARFFYCAKAGKKERGPGNNHPTVKPLSLMRYLIRLVTPPDSVLLDPFAGSGTTLLAAQLEGLVGSLGIEESEDYIKIIRQRLS